MRGRKTDKDFVFSFIQENLTKDVVSLASIMDKVDQEISEIDTKIKEVEQLKIKRCKLLHVKEFLQKK